MQQLEDFATNDAPSRRSAAAADCGERAVWVVDLATRRVVRALVGRRPGGLANGIGSGRSERPGDREACRGRLSETPATARITSDAEVKRTKHHEDLWRYEAVSTNEQSVVKVDRTQIEIRAYDIYCARGCVDGADLEDWLEAERQLRAEVGAEALAPWEGSSPEPAPTGSTSEPASV